MEDYKELLNILRDTSRHKDERAEAALKLGDLPYVYPDVLEELEKRSRKEFEKEKKVRKAVEEAIKKLEGKPLAPESETAEGTDETAATEYVYESGEVPFAEEYDIPPEDEWVDIALLAKIDETIEVSIDSEGRIKDQGSTSGQLTILNQGNRDRVWGIDLYLENNDKVHPEDNEEETLQDHIFIGDLDAQEEFEIKYKGTIENPSIIEVTQKYVDPQTDLPPNLIPGVEAKFNIIIRVTNTADHAVQNLELVKHLNEIATLQTHEATTGEISVLDDEHAVSWKVEELGANEEAELILVVSVEKEDLSPYYTGKMTLTYESQSEPQSGLKVKSLDGASNSYHEVERFEEEENPDNYKCAFVLGNLSEFNYILNKVIVYEGSLENGTITVDWKGENASDEEKTINPGEEFRLTWEYVSPEEPSFGYDVDFTVKFETKYTSRIILTIPEEELEFIAISIKKDFEVTEVQSYRTADVPTIITVEGLGNRPVEKLEIEDLVPEDFLPPKPEEIVVMKDGTEIPPEEYSVIIEPDDEDYTHPHTVKIILEHMEEKSFGPLKAQEELVVKYPIHAVAPKADKEMYIAPAKAIADIYPPLEQPISVETTEDLVAKLVVIHQRKRFRTRKAVKGVTIDGEKRYMILISGQNEGSAPVTIQIKDIIPEGFTLVGDTYEEPPVDKEEHTFGEAGKVITWTFTLQPKQVFKIKYYIKGEGEYNAKKAQAIIQA